MVDMTRSVDGELRTAPEGAYRIVVVVAVYNNAGTILEVLHELEPSGLPVIVVDDGSSDGTATRLDGWAAEEGANGRFLCRLAVNGGKARAMRAGFEWACEMGATHAITVDADGQHDTSRIGAFLAANDEARGGALITGTREPLARDYPMRNRIGRVTSNVAIRAQSGVRNGDIPCGYRLYPIRETLSIRCVSGRYAWEEEFVTRAAWAGMSVHDVQVPSIYEPNGNRVSHYKFYRDWTEGIAIYLWLLLLALVPRPDHGLRASRIATSRRIGALLAPGPFMSERMLSSTERSFFGLTAVIAIVLALVGLPASWITVACVVWVCLRWHVSLLAMLIALVPVLAGLVGPLATSLLVAASAAALLARFVPAMTIRLKPST